MRTKDRNGALKASREVESIRHGVDQFKVEVLPFPGCYAAMADTLSPVSRSKTSVPFIRVKHSKRYEHAYVVE
jgi:hypothetical protein